MIDALLSNLRHRDVLSPQEEAMLRSVVTKGKSFSVGEDLVIQDSRPLYSTLIVSGFAARYKLTAEGTRQITALHVAGDFVDLHAFLLKRMDHGIVALTECRVLMADHSDLLEISQTQPHLTRLLWLQTLVDGAIHREWIVAMGRRSKQAHLAHILCELFVRLKAVGLTHGQSFAFPLSQMEMADVLGISIVHMNRTIQALRKARLISWNNQSVDILDWQQLRDVAEFDGAYLCLSVERR